MTMPVILGLHILPVPVTPTGWRAASTPSPAVCREFECWGQYLIRRGHLAESANCARPRLATTSPPWAATCLPCFLRTFFLF